MIGFDMYMPASWADDGLLKQAPPAHSFSASSVKRGGTHLIIALKASVLGLSMAVLTTFFGASHTAAVEPPGGAAKATAQGKIDVGEVSPAYWATAMVALRSAPEIIEPVGADPEPLI